MSLVRLHNVHKGYDGNVVLREVFFRLSAGERIGLIGRNGSGKTTVLRLILGQEESDDGSVEVEPGTRIGYFSQFSALDDDTSVVDVLDGLFAHIHAIERELGEIGEALLDPPEGDALDRLLHRQAALLDAMERRDGWNHHLRIDTVLTRLGFSEAHRKLPVGQLSGGWRNRAALARIVLQEPDVLLLDEPTNFLDLAGLTWLEEWLRAFRGAAMIVSHDRDFLDRVVTGIVEIENYRFQEYPGDFARYVQLKRLRAKTLQRQFEHEEELLILEDEAIADRRELARDVGKALRRKLANIKKRVEPRPVDRIITGIYHGLHVPTALCRVEHLSKAYDDRLLFIDLSLEVQRGDRIAIVGPNASGKTTLLRVLAGEVEPDMGQVAWYKGADWVVFDDLFAALDTTDTVTHAVNVVGLAYSAPRRQVNRFLALMQFSEQDLVTPIGALSAGQKARVALAQALLSGAAAILLDEPTNHLDLPSIQVMERALVHFPGAVIVASHDRFFIDKVANRLLVFDGEGDVTEVSGNWTIYQASLGRAEPVAR